jgi:hypothetical protein
MYGIFIYEPKAQKLRLDGKTEVHIERQWLTAVEINIGLQSAYLLKNIFLIIFSAGQIFVIDD